MSKHAQISVDELPPPGEPLRPKTAEENKKLLEDELKERLRLATAKLNWFQLWRFNARKDYLAKILQRGKYNQLIQKRWQVWQAFQALQHELKQAPRKRPAQQKKLSALRAQGKALNNQLRPLWKFAREYKNIINRIAAHNQIVAWEKEEAANKREFEREAVIWREQIKSVMRQSPRMHYAGVDSKGNHFTRIPKIERTIFKDDRVYYQIKTMGQSWLGRLFGKWQSALPYGVDIKDLTSDETLENLAAGCNRVVTVERSKVGTNLFYVISRLDSPDGIPRKVLYQKIIDWYPVAQHTKTPWAAGVTNDRKVLWYNFEELPHILIAGSTQGGKSNHINQMIATIATMNTPEQVQFALIDLKGGIEFTHWKGLRHLARPTAANPEQVLNSLRWMRSVMEERLVQFERAKAKNLATFNECGGKLSRLICVVDELATLIGLGEMTNAIHNELSVLAAQGRAVGIHLILCTQHPTINILPNWIKTNCSLRISAKMPSHTASMIITDTITAALLPSIAGRMVFSAGRDEVIAQSPFISDAEIARAVSLSQQFAPLAIDTPKETAANIGAFGKDDVLDIALELGGKLSRTHIVNHIGKDKITEGKLRELIESIIEEANAEGKIVTHRGTQYRLKRDKRLYLLEAIGKTDKTNEDTDTEEFTPIDEPIEVTA